MPPPRSKSWVFRYAPVGVVLVVGSALSVGVGWGLYRQAVRADAARFEVETEYIAGTIEQTMERYEERLGRLADYCAMYEEMPQPVWVFRQQVMSDFTGNMPCVVHAVYCPRIQKADFQAHLQRGRQIWKDNYHFSPEQRAGREFALPVLEFWSCEGFEPIHPGTDMAQEESWHPSLAPSQGIDTWISPQPVRLRRKDGLVATGFWFVQTIFATNQQPVLTERRRDERLEDFVPRSRVDRAAVARGLLAAFISTDAMIDTIFNDPETPRRIYVRLYAAREPSPESLFSSRSTPPASPRHRRVIVQPWYERRWCLEMTSTALFESESPRGRAWLLFGGGTGMTLLTAALVAVALRARNRQELMTAEITEARDALAAAEREREKLGHDLHDGAIQSLYAVQLGLGRTSDKLAQEAATAKSELAMARNELDAVIAEIRRFILLKERNGERPVELAGVLSTIVQKAGGDNGARIQLQCEPAASERLSPSQAVQVANVAREALSNALRHGKAGNVEIKLRQEANEVRLEVSDDGAGFDTKTQAPGIGIKSMNARTNDLQGTLQITSAIGAGTRVVLIVPGETNDH